MRAKCTTVWNNVLSWNESIFTYCLLFFLRFVLKMNPYSDPQTHNAYRIIINNYIATNCMASNRIKHSKIVKCLLSSNFYFVDICISRQDSSPSRKLSGVCILLSFHFVIYISDLEALKFVPLGMYIFTPGLDCNNAMYQRNQKCTTFQMSLIFSDAMGKRI